MDTLATSRRTNNSGNEIKIAIIEGYASVYGNIDYADDIMVKGALDKSIEERKNNNEVFPMLYLHERRDIVGIFDPKDMKSTELGLSVVGEINRSTPEGERVYALVQQGALSGFSVGYAVTDKEFTYDKKSGKQIRMIKEARLTEISVVDSPMNEFTKITKKMKQKDIDNEEDEEDYENDNDDELEEDSEHDDKYSRRSKTCKSKFPLAKEDTSWDANEAIDRIREHTGSTDEPTSDYRNYFMWYDEKHPENFGSYKLPYVDIINGKPKVVPKAIYSVAGALNGARGGVNIPVVDKQAVIRRVNSYYSQMDKESPIKSTFYKHDIENMSSVEHLNEMFKTMNMTNQAIEHIHKKFNITVNRDKSESDKDDDIERINKNLDEQNKSLDDLKKKLGIPILCC